MSLGSVARPSPFKLNSSDHPSNVSLNSVPHEEKPSTRYLSNAKLKKFGIVNLSKHFKFQENHANILSKGLSFVPISGKTPVDQFALGIEKMIRTLKIKTSLINFNNSKGKRTKFKIPSNYTPPPNTYPLELDELHILLKQ